MSAAYISECHATATPEIVDDETDSQRIVIMGRFSDVRVAPVFSIRHTLFLALFCLLLLSASSDRTQASACASCLNGGKQTLPNSIFGFCRCQCAGSYVGPRCQFLSRKRSQNMNYSNQDLYRMLMQTLKHASNKRADDTLTIVDDDNSYYSDDASY